MSHQPPQRPLFQTTYLSFYMRVFPDRVEFKHSSGHQSIPINQITSIQIGMPLLMQITLETVSGATYSIPTTKKKEAQQAISQAQASLPQLPMQQPSYQQQPYHQPIPVSSQVKTYSSMKKFQRDQNRMAKRGWTVQTTTSHQPRRSVGGLLLIPFALLRPPKPHIIVTYQKMR